MAIELSKFGNRWRMAKIRAHENATRGGQNVKFGDIIKQNKEIKRIIKTGTDEEKNELESAYENYKKRGVIVVQKGLLASSKRKIKVKEKEFPKAFEGVQRDLKLKVTTTGFLSKCEDLKNKLEGFRSSSECGKSNLSRFDDELRNLQSSLDQMKGALGDDKYKEISAKIAKQSRVLTRIIDWGDSGAISKAKAYIENSIKKIQNGEALISTQDNEVQRQYNLINDSVQTLGENIENLVSEIQSLKNNFKDI